jgi:TonB family protein
VYRTQQLIVLVKKPARFHRIFTIWCAFALIVAASAAFPQLTRIRGQDLGLTNDAEAQLDSLATRVSDKMKKSKRGHYPTKVLVFDFTRESRNESSLLGILLADRFTDMLKHHTGDMEILDRDLLKNYLKKLQTNTADLGTNSVYLQIAEDLGATDAIRADLLEDEKQQLKISMQRLGREPEFHDAAQFLLPRDLEEILIKPAPSNYRDPGMIPPEAGVVLLGSKQIEGVDSPHCISCPDPTFTNAAREAKFKNGTVMISAVITTKGEVTSVYVLKGLPFGLTERAVTKVLDWKLKPAMKDGQPVAVRVNIEFKFQLL